MRALCLPVALLFVVSPATACDLPALPSYDELQPIAGLPDPFLSMDGHRIATREDWTCRRAEIAAQVREYELGPKPPAPERVTGTVADDVITVTVGDGGTEISFDARIEYPATGDGPFPAMIVLGSGTALDANGTISGQGVAKIYLPHDDIAEQRDGGSRGKGKLYELYPEHPAGALMAWAWGASRLIDALESTAAANIDATRLGVTGCSRNGKGALVVGAFDERIALTIPQEPGAGGASLWRMADVHQQAWIDADRMPENGAVQTLAQIVTENVWFRESFSRFSHTATRLPFDHHMVMGLVAPRALLMINNSDYAWLDKQGSHFGPLVAREIWKALGVPERMSASQRGGHPHCRDVPQAHLDLVAAYVANYLVGGGTHETGIVYTDTEYPDVKDEWIGWDTPQLAAAQPVGAFTHRTDIGAVETAGTAAYDEDAQTYTLTGSGTNMWGDEDEFFFAWRKMRGDFILSADAQFKGDGVDPHRKLGWMIRSSLDTDASYVDVALHGDGLTSMQFRREPGADTEEIVAGVTAADVLQLERRDGRYIMSVANKGDALTRIELTGIELPDEVYVGLFICAHNADAVEEGVFSNVRITTPAPADFVPYRDYYGSRLEVMDVETGHRRVVHTEDDSMQAPNWTHDGKALIYNRNGRLYRFDLATGDNAEIDTAFATTNNNDHAISFDGRRLAISHHSADHGGESMIYTLPLEGGVPQLVTQNAPSYFHGWSPDDEWLTFTGGRNGEWDIYKIRSDGSGDEVRLTDDPALDDGSEYSPDGAYIYFNSSRSGKMQIWRMRPDGSDQEPVTDDEYNNWFPHVSPDGTKLVYLAYMPDIDADDHPWYKHVYLVLRLLDSGESRVIANLYGGQGTINVPSWSPDSRRIAFVSN